MEPIQTTAQVPQDIKAVMKNAGNFEGRINLETSGFNENMSGHKASHDMILKQQPRLVKQEGAGINLPYEVRKEMALMLDDHQCALNTALRQYNKHHWLSKGAEAFISLHELMEEHIVKTQKHIDEVGERVSRLGGVPTAHPVTQHERSYIKHEVEGRYSIRDYLRNDLEHEMKIQQMLRHTIKRAHDLNDFGTVETLEEVLKDRENMGYNLYSILEDDTPAKGHASSGKQQ